MAEALIGVLLDVSGSMRNAYALDRLNDASVERTHAIITTIMNIVKREVYHHNRRESIFACAFGVSRGSIETCDLISLLDAADGPKDGYQALIDLAKENRAPHAEPWIKGHLSLLEARFLHVGLCRDRTLIPKLIELLPSGVGTAAVGAVRRGAAWLDWIPSVESSAYVDRKVKATVTDSEAYKFAQVVIDRVLQPQPTPKPVKDVSRTLDDLLNDPSSPSGSTQSSSSLHDRIQELIEQIQPFIFGYTPMCKSLKDARAVFQKTGANRKVLFILSDGVSSDGDPRSIAEYLRSSGVTIATCFLTSDHLRNPRCLYDAASPPREWETEDGRQVLFEMSSSMENTQPPITYLVDANWELPSSGESRLFIQANSLDVVNEFCRIVISQLTECCDALVDVIEKIDLATYINQKNATFEAQEQEGKTCYANALAAVFHLAMHRIVGREGGYPDFDEIRKHIVDEYGVHGATTKVVLRKVCPEYRLHFREVDETGARKALYERRPVVTRFTLYHDQWKRFSDFYRKNPKGILKKDDIIGGDPTTRRSGHAVVLTRCTPKCLTFMNSKGQDWGDGGFFRVEDQSVLDNTKFFDVYWTLDDLTPSEKEAFGRKGASKGQELSQTFPSVQELPYECPKCNRLSNVGEFSGHLLEAECPKCYQKFKPTNKGIMESLYVRAHNS